jgi:serine/threonine-protein kinase
MGKATGATRIVSWLDSAGKTQPLRAIPGRYFFPRISPDGKRLAVIAADGGNLDVWVYEWERDTLSRLTFTPEAEQSPVWSSDGRHLAFQSFRNGPPNLYWMRADGAGDTVRLTESKNTQSPYSISPDGKRLAFTENNPESGWDIWTLPLDLSDPDHPKPGRPELFLRTPFAEVQPIFSPDGRWLAYMSLESGRTEVYVRPFPGPGGKWQVSTEGGLMPVWSRNGRELFYRTLDNRIMVANYTAKGDAFVADRPRLWSEKRFLDTGTFTNFDLAPDGKHFAVLMSPDGETEQQRAQTHATFLLNFFDELRRKVPGK